MSQKKENGFKSGDLGGHHFEPTLLIHLSEISRLRKRKNVCTFVFTSFNLHNLLIILYSLAEIL